MYRLATCLWVSDLHPPTGFVGCADLELVVNMKNWRGFANELNVSVIAICDAFKMTKKT